MIVSLVAPFAILLSAHLARSQQPVYAQCGGQGWTGGTTCVSGSTCVYSNPYYSQCLPGSASSSSTTSKPITSTPTSTSTVTTPSQTGSPNAKYWFAFGDSYTTTGFNITGGLPNNANPLGNPAYPGYTGGGGANYVDYVTLTYNKSLLYTYNFAYGGATIDATLVAPYEPTVASLTDQVNQYLSSIASHPASTPWTATNTLFSVWIGINDIGNSYYNGGGSAFNTKLINAYFALVQKLYASGARNFFFINVPPVDRSPLMLAQSTTAQSQEKTAILDFNSQLSSAISTFKASNTGVTTWTWDSNAAFTTILNSPTTYGFVDATSYGNTGDFWGNNYHPGPAAHQIFAQQIGNTVLSGTVW